jgi:tRNA nucleotidyltransferase/poly(A) polymerase
MKIDLININPTALYMLWILEDAGYEARICGGAVRDILMDTEPKDWDIATTALPEQVVAAMNAQDINVIPTGLQHGTVTAVKDSEPYEITTLRTDDVTDGRHAEVSFTTDWELDSKRRDFTMNAMYMDADGTVYDYHNGVADIKKGVINFVGDPVERIREDYLRILRYYRFMGRFGFHLGGWEFGDIIKENVEGLRDISGERIWSEMKKIVGSAIAVSIIDKMHRAGVMDAIGMAGMTNITNMYAEILPNRAGPEIVIARCYETDNLAEWLDVLVNKFHAAKHETDPLRFVVNMTATPDKTSMHYMMAFHGKRNTLAWYAIHDKQRYSTVKELKMPEFPISGNDLIAMGVPKGPEMGKMLHTLKSVWAGSMFNMTRGDLGRHAHFMMEMEV